VKIGDFHGYAAQRVHFVQIFKSYSGYVIKRETKTELGAEDMFLAPELFFNRVGLYRPQTIFTNAGIGHNIILTGKDAFSTQTFSQAPYLFYKVKYNIHIIESLHEYTIPIT
jgi:hypothetical protein